MTGPLAGAGSDELKARLRAIAAQRGLAGAANNTRWNELIALMRHRDGWRPSYRYKWLEGYLSPWDVEWWYHLPFPFVGVEWFDMSLQQRIRVGQLVADKVVDHAQWILPKLEEIGFEHEVSGDVVRIWGYLPKSYEDFPPGAKPMW